MKQNVKIATLSIKGGVGKTQICATAAMHFSDHLIPVKVIDADLQQSLSRKRQRELAVRSDKWVPYTIDFINTSDIESVRLLMAEVNKYPCCFMFDCPGNVNDPGLTLIYQELDYAIIPYELNADSVDATILFARLFKQHFRAKLFFVPNKVSSVFEQRGEVRKAREDAVEALGKLGIITPDIKMTTCMNGYSTIDSLGRDKRSAIKEAFYEIMKPIWRVYNNK